LSLEKRAQGGGDLEVAARANLEKDVSSLRARRLADVDEHHRATLAALRHELALRRQRVLAEMARVALGGIAAPVHDEVRPILDLAERARNLAAQLGSYLSGAVSKRGVTVNHASDRLGEGDRLALCLARDVAEAVHQRHVRVVQEVGGGLHGGV